MSTSKFDRVLSDVELTIAINDGCTSDLFSLAERVEQAVLAKLAEQEPVAWAANAALRQDYYLSYGCPAEVFASKEALLNEYDKAEVVPLYTHPMPANGQVSLDSSNAGQAIPNGWQLVPKEPTDDMLVSGQEEWVQGRRGALEDCEESAAIYKAMLAAAPTHKEAKE